MKLANLALVGLVFGCQPTAPPTPATPPVVVPVQAPVAELTLEPGFERIPFSEMAVFPADATTATTWTVEGEEFLCTGKPKCYLHTKLPLGDGTLRYDSRFEPDPKLNDPAKLDAQNTGVLFFIQEPHAIWPKSIEVQGKQVEMGQLRPNGGATPVKYQDHPKVREAVRKPVGEWNSIEVRTKAGAITVSLNGQIVAEGEPGELTTGLIGLQAEGHRLRYRRLRFAAITE